LADHHPLRSDQGHPISGQRHESNRGMKSAIAYHPHGGVSG
jgi:hypothetical protein